MVSKKFAASVERRAPRPPATCILRLMAIQITQYLGRMLVA